MSDDVITIKKENLWKYSTFILAALLVVVLFMFTGKDGAPTANIIAGWAGVNNPSPSQVQATADDDAVLGNKNAPVTIIEFSDYQCPFCERFWSQTLPQIKQTYVDTGKVKIVFRDFPLDFHPFALPAALAAECVKEKGGDEAYWKMHDKIFGNQASLSTDNLKQWARDLGYDIGNCLDIAKYRAEVQKDQQDGAAAGVRGTPAFFVNGRLISGAQPFSAFQQAIDAALAA